MTISYTRVCGVRDVDADSLPTATGGFRLRRLSNEIPFESATEQSSLLL